MPDKRVRVKNAKPAPILGVLKELDRKVNEVLAARTQEPRELQVLSKRVEDGFAESKQEWQAIAKRLDDLISWLHKEIPEAVHILSNMIDRARQEALANHKELQSAFAEFKREEAAQDKDVQLRLSRLETARSLN